MANGVPGGKKTHRSLLFPNLNRNYVQVLNGRVLHIYYVPSTPEPYYNPNGMEPQPKPIGEECGTIVYQYYPMSAVNYVSFVIWETTNRE